MCNDSVRVGVNDVRSADRSRILTLLAAADQSRFLSADWQLWASWLFQAFYKHVVQSNDSHGGSELGVENKDSLLTLVAWHALHTMTKHPAVQLKICKAHR